jgi:hypothetical protein
MSAKDLDLDLYLNNLLKSHESLIFPDKLENTIALIKESENWENFLQKYDQKKHLGLLNIEPRVQDYYRSIRVSRDTISPPDGAYDLGVPSWSSLSKHKRPPAIGEGPAKSPIPDDIILSDYREETINTRDGPTIMYYYKRKNGDEFPSWKPLHPLGGGKRKSRRNRKSKKSRKKLRKSNRRR